MPWYENAEADFERDFGCMIQLDDYKLRHMATHLYAAGQHGRLRRLLLGNKAWLEAKFVRLGNDRGYVTDIDILLGDLADPIHPDGVVDAIAAWVARSCVEARVRAYTDSDLRLLVLLNRQAEAC